jgi:hypothetical protein
MAAQTGYCHKTPQTHNYFDVLKHLDSPEMSVLRQQQQSQTLFMDECRGYRTMIIDTPI